MQTHIIAARVTFKRQAFAKPLLLSTGAIQFATQADVVVRAVTDGRAADGRGCIYLSDLWSWPDPALAHEVRDTAMREYCRFLAARLAAITGAAAHPLSLGLRLHHAVVGGGETVGLKANAEPQPSALARAVCASPFDAAIHDAAGRALGLNAFQLYESACPIPEADAYFQGGVCRAIQRLVLRPPRTTSPAWWIVGRNDDLENGVRPAVEHGGYFAFKVKIMGQDAHADAERTAQLAQAARRWGLPRLLLSIDSNEANPDAASVLAYLAELKRLDPAAYDALVLIEQPTARDITAHPHDWHAVAARKPVLLDEGLLALEVMAVAKRQGWSGFALKTCKGHSFALVAAAWASQQGLCLSLQDLTNPGLAAVHAGLFAAYVPTLNGVELNSPQFTPQANRQWTRRFPGLFGPRDGRLSLPRASLLGLGTG